MQLISGGYTEVMLFTAGTDCSWTGSMLSGYFLHCGSDLQINAGELNIFKYCSRSYCYSSRVPLQEKIISVL